MSTILIKLSGNVIAEKNNLKKLAGFIHDSHKKGDRVILTHGGGKQINELSNRLDIPVQQMAGRRITDEKTREILLFTVGGSANRELTAQLRKHGVHSVGISGIDGALTTAIRRPPIMIEGKKVDFGLVGEINNVEPGLLLHLMKGGYVPVVGCLTWSAEEGILNINADTFAISLSLAIKADQLIMLMEPPAVLDEKKEPLNNMNYDDWQRGLRDGWVKEGMKPKLQTAFSAIEKGLPSVLLANMDTLLAGGGTRLSSEFLSRGKSKAPSSTTSS